MYIVNCSFKIQREILLSIINAPGYTPRDTPEVQMYMYVVHSVKRPQAFLGVLDHAQVTVRKTGWRYIAIGAQAPCVLRA